MYEAVTWPSPGNGPPTVRPAHSDAVAASSQAPSRETSGSGVFMSSVPVATVDPATGDAVTPARPASPAGTATRPHGTPTRSPPGRKRILILKSLRCGSAKGALPVSAGSKETTEERKSFLAALGRDSPPVDNDPTPNRVLCPPTTFPLRHRHRLRLAARGGFRNTGPGESTYPRAREERLAKPASQQVLHRPLQRHARLHDPWPAALPRPPRKADRPKSWAARSAWRSRPPAKSAPPATSTPASPPNAS